MDKGGKVKVSKKIHKKVTVSRTMTPVSESESDEISDSENDDVMSASESDDVMSPQETVTRKHLQDSDSDSEDTNDQTIGETKILKHKTDMVGKHRQSKVSKQKDKTLKKKNLDKRSSQIDSDEPETGKKRLKTESSMDVKEEDEEEFTAIKEELSHMTFEELQKLRDRLGMKMYNQVLGRGDRRKKDAIKQTFTRENKNRPMEMSSKRRVPRYREIMPVKKKVIRDPRFDELSGKYDEAAFRNSYAFLDEVKEKEKEKLSKQLKKAKNAEKKQELKYLLNRMNQQDAARQQRTRRKELEKEWKKKEMDQVKEGKNPYFLKKGDLRKLELAEKYKELKKSGRLEKYLGKKRKKNASKEKKKLPTLE